MTRLRSNEWNFSSNAAARISEVLKQAQFATSPLGHAEAELTEYMGNKRLDLVIYDRSSPPRPIITAELKVPWDALGRTPYNSKVVEDAHRKASNCGATYFVTWTIRRAVVWRTDDPGVPLPQRVVADQELIQSPLTGPADLSRPEFQNTWKKAVDDLVATLHGLVVGPPQPTYLPLDQQFIGKLESLLEFPIQLTAEALRGRMSKDNRFRRSAEAWMRDKQGWIVSQATASDNVDRASRFTCYVLVNRLAFYNALRRKYPKLPKLTLGSRVNSGVALKSTLERAFASAMRYTGDYDTVFSSDTGDDFPFLSDDGPKEWRVLIQSLAEYDFATIDLEIIGAMYERLISPEERHRYGQHYTKPTVVDLINAFSIRGGNDVVLDPACGGGTFLVRAYNRKRFLEGKQDHAALLSSLYGCDILQYACHLSVINLAVRDLIDDDNFPRIHMGDFLRVSPGSVFAELPTRIVAGGLPTGTRQLQLTTGMCDAVVGNPPYIQSKQIPLGDRQAYLALARREWPQYEWSASSDILVWFFTHSAAFVRMGGSLSLLTQSAWLDVEYGVPLQHWMLENFRLVSIMESEVEPWFSDARVATVVVVLERESDRDARNNNSVRFVQFKEPLSQAGAGTSEAVRQGLVKGLRDAILGASSDMAESRFRVRLVKQSALLSAGSGAGAEYVGSKWGRYLRALNSLYDLHRDKPASFCRLEDLAEVARGVTTNCDDFFIVADVSSAALAKYHAAAEFQSTFGARRTDVETSKVRIVRRGDGAELALEANQLVPAMRTARDVTVRRTSDMKNDAFAVRIDETRQNLSRLTEAYVRAGEREHFHESVSFAGRSDWFVLRETKIAPILFVKTIQYTPQLLWNDSGLLANQRLYNIAPVHGVNSEVLAATLSSTIFAAERFAGVKALGREAANDVEVFTARQFKLPDVRVFGEAHKSQLRSAFSRLRKREAGPLVEKTLMEAGLREARVYVEQNPVGETVWPDELRDVDRQEIDLVLLLAVGLSKPAALELRKRLYNELVAFTRRARLLELEAQANRRGASDASPSTSQLADDLWAELIGSGQATVQILPNDFLPPGCATETFELPAGKVSLDDGDLFSRGRTCALRFGRDQEVRFAFEQQRDLAKLLAERRVRGTIKIPKNVDGCVAVSKAIEDYLSVLMPKLELGAMEITDNKDLQQEILGQAFRRLLPLRQ